MKLTDFVKYLETNGYDGIKITTSKKLHEYNEDELQEIAEDVEDYLKYRKERIERENKYR